MININETTPSAPIMAKNKTISLQNTKSQRPTHIHALSHIPVIHGQGVIHRLHSRIEHGSAIWYDWHGLCTNWKRIGAAH